MFCRNCGTMLPPNASVCTNCNVPSGEGNHFCHGCGTQHTNADQFCSKCGTPLGSSYYRTNNQGYQGNQGNQGNQGYPPNQGNQGYQTPPYSQQNGYNQGYPPPPFNMQQKSRMIAGLLAIFLGTLGIHNFYLGYNKKAVIQIILSTIGGILTCGVATLAVSVWALVEAVQIFIGNIATDADGVPLRD